MILQNLLRKSFQIGQQIFKTSSIAEIPQSSFTVDLSKFQMIKTPEPSQIVPEYQTDINVAQQNLFDKQKLLLELDIIQNKPLRSAYFCVQRGGKYYHVFDASQIPLGRMAVQIATLLQGKHKPDFKRNVSTGGDHCVVVNAQDILITGKQAKQKVIRYHTGFVGHLREVPYKFFMQEKPEQLVFYVVGKMLPKNLLRQDLLKKLEVFREPQHTYGSFLPNFRPYDQIDVREYMGTYFDITQIIQDKNTEIAYFDGQLLPEFKDLKINLDSEIELDFNERKKIFKLTDENQKVASEWAQYQKDLKRKIPYKFKAPKNRDPNVTGRDIFVTKESQIKQFKIKELQGLENIPEEDETVIQNVKW